MNKVLLCGNLTKDVELSTTNSGVSVGRFTIAVSRAYANQDGERETDFINIIVWRNTADNCAKFLKKGSKALVEGELHIRSYENNDGEKRYATEVVADRVEFVGQKASGSANDEGGNEHPDLEPIDDDSLPF